MKEAEQSKGTLVRTLTQVTAELSQHAVWVGSGNLSEACQNEHVTVLQGTLVHRLDENTTNTQFAHIFASKHCVLTVCGSIA